jgi:hypothetical protein
VIFSTKTQPLQPDTQGVICISYKWRIQTSSAHI